MKIIRFFKAIVRYIRFGKRVTFNDYVYRLTVCETCNHLNKENWSCEKCGCYLDKKAKMSTENCPDDKW
jgi:ribosomal protein L32